MSVENVGPKGHSLTTWIPTGRRGLWSLSRWRAGLLRTGRTVCPVRTPVQTIGVGDDLFAKFDHVLNVVTPRSFRLISIRHSRALLLRKAGSLFGVLCGLPGPRDDGAGLR